MPRRLDTDFEQLIFEHRAYLESHLTVTEVARRLHSNKTYVSRLVNESYGMSFPDLINSLRIRYAREYLAAHPGARQHEVAARCGFSSAAFFNQVFKHHTGHTPSRHSPAPTLRHSPAPTGESPETV